MLADSLELMPGSRVLNTLIESGVAFPTTGSREGRVFFLTENIPDYAASAYVYDGAAWKVMGRGPIAVVKYDIGLFCGGRVDEASAVLAAYITPRTTYLEAHLPGAVAKCKVPPLVTTQYLINVEDIASGTVTFNPGSTTGIIDFPYSLLVDPAQYIELQGPASPDTAISDVGLTIVANVNVEAGVIGA